MIFFFGTRSSTLLTDKLSHANCAYCNKPDTIYASVTSSYFHIFWIPVFPIDKKYYSHCVHCKQTLTGNQMPATYHNAVSEIAQRTKTPIWQFIGLILLSIPILFIIIAIIFT